MDKLLANHTTRFDPTNLSAIPAPPIIEITSPGPKGGKTELLFWIIAILVLGSDTQPSAEDVEQHQANESTRDTTKKTSGHANEHEPRESEIHTGDNDADIETDITHGTTTEQQGHQDPTPSDPPRETHDPIAEQAEDQILPPSTKLPSEPHIAPTTVALLTTSPPNIPRLSQILLHHLQTLHPAFPLSSARETVHAALSHIHIFQPTSLSSLIATISSLPAYFLDPKNGSAERKLGAIIIDSPSTYFWADKVAATGQPQEQGQGQSRFPALASTFKRISTTLSAPVIFSSQHLSSSSTTSDSAALRPQLPAPFSTLPTLRLIISRSSVQGFSKDVDAETAVKYQEGRDKAVREAGFRVRVNRWADEGRGDGGGSGDSAGFEVRIDGKGITVS